MKSLTLLLILLISSCTSATSQERSWSFIQSIGGIKIGQAYKDNDTYYLPIQVDVSGLQEITTKPTMLNSALMCSRTGHLIKDNEIHISIFTALINDTASKNCKAVPLINVKEGVYAVYYSTSIDGMHQLGTISIRSNN